MAVVSEKLSLHPSVCKATVRFMGAKVGKFKVDGGRETGDGRRYTVDGRRYTVKR